MSKEQCGLMEETSWATRDQELSSGSEGNNLCGSPEAITIMQVRGDGDQ